MLRRWNVVGVTTRPRITMMIRERIPRNVVADRNVESYESRTPPTTIAMVVAARTPGPVVVVVDPATVVIRSPTPRFISDPRPTVRPNPGPGPMTIRRPVYVVVDDRDMWSPDPAVVVYIKIGRA